MKRRWTHIVSGCELIAKNRVHLQHISIEASVKINDIEITDKWYQNEPENDAQ